MHSIKWPEKNHREKRVKQRRGNQGKCRENGGGEVGKVGMGWKRDQIHTRKYRHR